MEGDWRVEICDLRTRIYSDTKPERKEEDPGFRIEVSLLTICFHTVVKQDDCFVW